MEVLPVCGVDWREWEAEVLPVCGVDWREWEAEVLPVCGEHAGRVTLVSWVPSQMACVADCLPEMLVLVAEARQVCRVDCSLAMLVRLVSVVAAPPGCTVAWNPLMLVSPGVALPEYAADWKPAMRVWVVVARSVYAADWKPLMLVSEGVVLLVCEYLQVA